ncbi:MAG: ECF transporter S component [Oscillospiraceae bacterium]
MSKQRISTRNMAVIAMFSAVSFVAVLISQIIPTVAGFLSYDPKDAIIVIAGFIMGPMASVAISVIVSFIEMITISTTGPYGFLMNVVSTCAFAVPAAWFYKKNHSQKGAVIGLLFSVVVLVICMAIWNYVVTPYYMGVERQMVADMMFTVFVPFNLAKGGINAGLSLLLYRPIVGSLRKAGLVEQSSSSHKKTFSAGFTLFAAAVIVTFVLLLLVLLGVL